MVASVRVKRIETNEAGNRRAEDGRLMFCLTRSRDATSNFCS